VFCFWAFDGDSMRRVSVCHVYSPSPSLSRETIIVYPMAFLELPMLTVQYRISGCGTLEVAHRAVELKRFGVQVRGARSSVKGRSH